MNFVNKIFSKAPVRRGMPNLMEIFTAAIQSQDIKDLKDLSRFLRSKVDYDSKYQGAPDDKAEYEEEQGYKWEDLNRVYKELEAWLVGK